MNLHAVRAIYIFEMHRWVRTHRPERRRPGDHHLALLHRLRGRDRQRAWPRSTGSATAPSSCRACSMLSILTESISNGSFGIYMPKFAGTIYEVLSAPVSAAEVVLGYVGAAATKSFVLGLVILATARIFVPYEIDHPFVMLAFLVLTSVTFSLFGFLTGIWADGWEKLSIIPTLVITPLTFLGGSFYSIDMLPGVWKTIALFNPVVYLVSGFRWSFYGVSDVGVGISLAATLGFLAACLAAVTWIFRTAGA